MRSLATSYLGPGDQHFCFSVLRALAQLDCRSVLKRLHYEIRSRTTSQGLHQVYVPQRKTG